MSWRVELQTLGIMSLILNTGQSSLIMIVSSPLPVTEQSKICRDKDQKTSQLFKTKDLMGWTRSI